MNPDHLTKEEKIIASLKAIEKFFDSLGENDIYKKILLEELMKLLMEKK